MVLDLRTEAEKARDQKLKAICDHFIEVCNSAQGYKISRIIKRVAEDCGVSTTFVRQAIIKAGLYKPATRLYV